MKETKFFVFGWTDNDTRVTIQATSPESAKAWEDLFRLCQLHAGIAEVTPLDVKDEE